MKRLILFTVLFHFISQASAQKNITAGFDEALFVCGDGSAKACGSNGYGQLSDGTNIGRLVPVSCLGIPQIKSIDCHLNHTIFLHLDGTVSTCGWNKYGQLGDGTYRTRHLPTQLSGLSGIIDIAAANWHSLFVKNDGTVWSTGDNSYGQLGNGTNISSNIPVQVQGLTGITAVAAGTWSSFFLKNDGTVWACGEGGHGQLGNGLNSNSNLPVQVSGLTGIVAIASSGFHCLFLKNDGSVWATGENNYGQLGIGSTTKQIIPTWIFSISNVKAISAGGYHSLFIKNDGTVWACGLNKNGQLGNGTTTDSNIPIQVLGLNNIINIASGLYQSIFEDTNGITSSCGWNLYGQLGDGTNTDRYLPTLVQNLCPTHIIRGTLYSDSLNNCTYESFESRIPFIPVVSNPTNFFSTSNDSGYYSLGAKDSINYLVAPIIQTKYSSMFKKQCPINYSVYFDTLSPKDTSGFDFGFDFSPCAILRVDVGGDRKRRCFPNKTSITYSNEGFASVNNVEVRVQFSEYDIPLSASLPYSIDPADSSLVFNIGTLNHYQGGTITITDSVACISGITGLTQCIKAWILPVNQCLKDSTAGPGWDKSSLKVTGSCANDTVRFVIYNVGTGNMATPSWYRIYEDNFLVDSVSFQLVAGDSLVVMHFSKGTTVRLEADQHPDHPGSSRPRATVEACGLNSTGGFSRGKVNEVPQDDEDVDVEIDCMEIRDSYDPNEKVNSPEGLFASHDVLPNTPIDFTVHFQNTGTDTAYKVVIVDSLSNDLDLATFELGTSSHPYNVSLSGQGVPVLKFTFDNIMLVDSFTDEINSHGFVKYKIAPKAATPLGTRINNSADIYFDYNFPVRTNTAFVTLGSYPLSTAIRSISSVSNSISIYPNPTTGEFKVQSSKLQMNRIELYNIMGEKLFEQSVNSLEQTLNLNLANGIYFLNCVTDKGSERIKIIKQ